MYINRKCKTAHFFDKIALIYPYKYIVSKIEKSNTKNKYFLIAIKKFI